MTAPRVPLGVLDDLEATLRARVQRVLGRRIGAPAIQLTADLFRPGEGPLAPVLAAVRAVAELCEAADEKVRGSVPASITDRLIADGTHTVYVGKVRAALSSALGAEGDHRG